MSASMIAPALDQILPDLGMSASVGQIAFSVFFLGLGFAPFVVAPVAETYGRRPTWLFGNIWYIIWNSLCPVSSTSAMMIVGRLMSASGCSVGITVSTPDPPPSQFLCLPCSVQLTGPVLADMYTAKDRGKSLAIASVLPYLGPALGPIVGGLAAQHLRWAWLFWILSIADAVFLCLGLIFIQETYAPVLLRHKEKALIKARSDATAVQLPNEKSRAELFRHEVVARILPAFSRPFQLMFHRPIIAIIALSAAVEFGVYTIVLSTFASLWITRYHMSETSASLHYIAIALGAYICSQIGSRLMDYLWRRLKAGRPNQEPTPEYRVPYILFGLFPGVVGIFWYAWAAERNAHWAVVDLGILIFSCGAFMFAQGLMAYQIDEFTSTRAASANAATRVWTYILGFAFPIFAPKLYERLGYGWGNSLLGFLFTVLSVPTTFILWFWGDKLRAIGRRAEDEKERIV